MKPNSDFEAIFEMNFESETFQIAAYSISAANPNFGFDEGRTGERQQKARLFFRI